MTAIKTEEKTAKSLNRITTTFDEKDIKWLKKESLRTDRAAAWLVRNIVENHIVSHKKKTKKA